MSPVGGRPLFSAGLDYPQAPPCSFDHPQVSGSPWPGRGVGLTVGPMNKAHVIGVVGGSGGVGASALTAAIAVRGAQAGLQTICLDGDRLGGGLDVTLGIEQERGLRWPDLAGARGRIDGAELIRQLPSVEGVAVLSFDRARDLCLTREILNEGLRALSCADLVVVDLPRPDHEVFSALSPSLDAIVLLAGSGIGDLAGASAIAAHLIGACPDVWLCLRSHGRGGGFAETVAVALDLPLIAILREEPSLAADLLHGIPPGTSQKGALAAAADTVLAQFVVNARRDAS
jgi:secretion/DNA translocation related CpaE-like protein